MMSAKSIFNDAKASAAPASASAPAGSAATPATPAEALATFQNLLAGAVPPIEPQLVDGAPVQPLIQLLSGKAPGVSAKPANGSATAPATGTALPADLSPADLLKLLDDASTIAPADGEAAKPAAELPERLVDPEELKKSDEEVIADWLEMMIPQSVFAQQAGAVSGDTAQGQGSAADASNPGATPASLMRQALVAEALNPIDVAPTAAASNATQGIPLKPDAMAAIQSSVTAFAAAMAPKSEATEKDKPLADNWMNALGDLSAKRAADVQPTAAPRLSTPVHDTRWADALAHRLVMMAKDGESSASLKLVPQDLGPLDIQINVRDGDVSVHFGAAHPETRAVLEASMPRLRELLGAQGLQLGNASVSHQSAGQNRAEKSSGPSAVGAVTEESEVSTAKAVSTSLLDTYA